MLPLILVWMSLASPCGNQRACAALAAVRDEIAHNRSYSAVRIHAEGATNYRSMPFGDSLRAEFDQGLIGDTLVALSHGDDSVRTMHRPIRIDTLDIFVDSIVRSETGDVRVGLTISGGAANSRTGRPQLDTYHESSFEMKREGGEWVVINRTVHTLMM